MSRKFRTDEDYLRSGRVPFVFHDDTFGDVTIYEYKKGRARVEFKRVMERCHRQLKEQRKLAAENLKKLKAWRVFVLQQQRDLEKKLGIPSLDSKKLF